MNSNDEKDGGIGDVLRWLRLKSEDDLYDYGVSLVNHFNETWKMAVLWIAVLSLLTIVYIFAAAYEFNNHSSAGTHSDVYNVIYVVSVIILMIATIMLTLTSARVGIYSAAMMLFEGVTLAIVDVMYSIVSAVTPDLIEKALDKNEVLKNRIKEAVDNKTLTKLAKDIIQGYLSAMAWALFIPWLVLALPLAVFENPTVVFMSIIAIALLIYMVLAWSDDGFWYPLMKEGAKYAAAGYIIIYLVVVPIAKQTGIFEGFGPASAGYLRTGFWFVLFVIILAILSAGFKYQKDEKDGKRKLELSAFPIGVALVILLAGLIFGNLALTKVDAIASTVAAVNSNSAGDTETGNKEIVSNGNPHYANPGGKLIENKAYKLPGPARVYIYQAGKLRPVDSESAYFKFYGCAGNQRVIDCAPVYVLPSGIDVNSTKYKGEVIK